MRSVVRLRTRPGRPVWQLTTRPSTAAVLALVSLAAAGVQIALFSSPTPGYQVAVVAFWVVVGLAFVGSAVGTRSRARRQAAASAARPPADPMPFVPVPVRPARPRRREAEGSAAGGVVATTVAEIGEPTDPVEAPPTTAHRPGPTRAPTEHAVTLGRPLPVADRPSPSRRPVVAEGRVPAPARDRITSAPRPAPSWRPSRAAEERTSTVAVTSRHAVRAVALADSASREVPVSAGSATERHGTSRRALTAETIAIRDGRVRPRPDAADRSTPGRTPSGPAGATRSAPDRAADEPARAPGDRPGADRPSPRPTGRGKRRLADESRAAAVPRRGGAAPTGAVPSPRQAPSGERPTPAAARRAEPARHETGTVRRSTHARTTAPRDATGTGRPSVEREVREEPRTPGANPARRRERPTSTETTAPFGGGMTFGGRAVPVEPAPESWAPAPRRPEPGPATGRHAALAATPVTGVPQGASARHAVAAESGRRRAS